MTQPRSYLISPVADFFLVGGLFFCLIVPFFLFEMFFFKISVSAFTIAAASIAFIVNDPHFNNYFLAKKVP